MSYFWLFKGLSSFSRKELNHVGMVIQESFLQFLHLNIDNYIPDYFSQIGSMLKNNSLPFWRGMRHD